MPDGPVDDSAVLDALFAGSPQGLFLLDADRKVTRCDPSARGVRGLSADAVVGHDVADFAPAPAPELGRLIDEVLATGEPLRGRLVRGRSPSEPDRTLAVEVSVFPLRGAPGLVGVVEDVTERQAAADRLAVLTDVHRTVGATLDVHRTVGATLDVHRTVGATLDVRATADALAGALVPAFAEAAAVDLLDDDPAGGVPPPGPLPTSVPLRRVAFAAPDSVEPVGHTGDSSPFPFPTPYTQALSDAHARLVRVTPDDPWPAADPDGFTALTGHDVHSPDLSARWSSVASVTARAVEQARGSRTATPTAGRPSRSGTGPLARRAFAGRRRRRPSALASHRRGPTAAPDGDRGRARGPFACGVGVVASGAAPRP